MGARQSLECKAAVRKYRALAKMYGKHVPPIRPNLTAIAKHYGIAKSTLSEALRK